MAMVCGSAAFICNDTQWINCSRFVFAVEQELITSFFGFCFMVLHNSVSLEERIRSYVAKLLQSLDCDEKYKLHGRKVRLAYTEITHNVYMCIWFHLTTVMFYYNVY